jgi:hypothetical protein
MEASSTSPVVILRRGRRADHDLIIASWLRSMRSSFVQLDRDGNRVDPLIRVKSPVFFGNSDPSMGPLYTGQQLRIKRLISDPETRVECVAATDDMDVVLSWAIARGDCLHYVYVKEPFRRQGHSKMLIRSLLPNGMRRFSVHTRSGDSFIVSRHPNAVYDPFAIDPRDA